MEISRIKRKSRKFKHSLENRDKLKNRRKRWKESYSRQF